MRLLNFLHSVLFLRNIAPRSKHGSQVPLCWPPWSVSRERSAMQNVQRSCGKGDFGSDVVYNWVVVSNSFHFHPYWGRFTFWLIFFRWFETTNQISITFRLIWISVRISTCLPPNRSHLIIETRRMCESVYKYIYIYTYINVILEKGSRAKNHLL